MDLPIHVQTILLPGNQICGASQGNKGTRHKRTAYGYRVLLYSTNKSWYQQVKLYCSLFSMVIIPKGQYFDGSLFRKVIIPLSRIVIIPNLILGSLFLI